MMGHMSKDEFKNAILQELGLETPAQDVTVFRNPSVPVLYENAIKFENGVVVTSIGALAADSGLKKGRSPKDKRIVYHGENLDSELWWGEYNIKADESTLRINLERAVNYLSTRPRLYVIDGFAGWNKRYRQKIRVICSRAYHALFMRNMLIRPTPEELEDFGTPDLTIYNAGDFPANKYTQGMTSSSSICLSLSDKKMVILGTCYAGEMKKGVFSFMHYMMPLLGVLSLHSSANVGSDDDVTLFFGLSGTGKTTLSADPRRQLIGDDEHCWSSEGVFNIEGGCYAKCIGLRRDLEPEIFDAIRFGSVLENVVYDPVTRVVDYSSSEKTENTRCAYPIEYVANAKIACMAGHPKNIIMLTCDAFGVLPPVSKLTPGQAMYHFISGYTAKTPGTETGVVEPSATFSTCFGAPFIVFHPTKYAEMLSEKMTKHNVSAWLINTGWTGGKYGSGTRMPLKYSRAIIDAIHSGALAAPGVEYFTYSDFKLQVPKSIKGIPPEILNPQRAWKGTPESYQEAMSSLVEMFRKNFQYYKATSSPEILNSGPC